MLSFISQSKISHQKLFDLLKMTQKSESLYFKAANNIQVTECARFLYYHSTRRNDFYNKLKEAFTQCNIECANISEMEKRALYIQNLHCLEKLHSNSSTKKLRKCLNQDIELINLCTSIIKNKDLPKILGDLVLKEMNNLLITTQEGEKLLKKLQQPTSKREATATPLSRNIC